MSTSIRFWRFLLSLPLTLFLVAGVVIAEEPVATLKISWENRTLKIEGDSIPGGSVDVWYIEAYCKAGSSNREWKETVIPHKSRLSAQAENGHAILLVDKLDDGVIVEHRIFAGDDHITFDITARNPTDIASELAWAQPCIRVDRFSGTSPENRMDVVPPYAKKCFVFVDDQPVRLPTRPWATEAIYTPGQVYAANGVSRDDVNPRPLSDLVPSSSLMACLSGDEKQLIGVAFEPCQELFQGVITCIHSDFRIDGLQPGESKKARGKIYLLPADLPALHKRYRTDFK